MMNDLLLLLADLDAKNALEGLLSRPQSLNIAPIQAPTIIRHLNRDNGCCHDYASLLRGYQRDHRFVLIIFDKHGSGRDNDDTSVIETDIEQQLEKEGWHNRCAVIVLEPELEAWIWSDSPHILRILGWKGTLPEVRSFLEGQNLWKLGEAKPFDPKKAFERVCRHSRRTISAGIFKDVASAVGLERCQDRAFLKLKATLQQWFPA
jgi:hypothetical protein